MNPAQYILLAAVRIYRAVISPALGAFFGPTGGCRFTPTCSAYAAEAVRTHGAVVGSWLATRRLCRCHPWGDCGYDPVPQKNKTPGAGLKSPVLECARPRAQQGEPSKRIHQNQATRLFCVAAPEDGRTPFRIAATTGTVS